jgi:hypothetical protein
LGALIAAATLRPRDDPRDRPADRDYSQYPAGQNTADALSIIAIAEEVQRTRKEAYTAEADKRWREILTVGGILIYTVITAGIAFTGLYQAQIFKETEKRQLRAYIGLGLLTVQCCNTADEQISLLLENDGQTPAEYLDSVMTWVEYSNDEQFPDDFECSRNSELSA